MITFIKKDLLLFWRSRKDMLAIVVLPIILVVVLSYAFSGMTGMNTRPVEVAMGLVNEDVEEEGLRLFEQELDAAGIAVQAPSPNELAGFIKPVSILHDYLYNPEMTQWMKVMELDEAEARQLVADGKLDGYLKIPQGYTYDTLRAMFQGQGSQVRLPLIVKENTMNAEILEHTISQLYDQMNFHWALQHTAGGDISSAMAIPVPAGGREMLEGGEPFTMAQYFTLAMGALFALFIAATVAEKTAAEKREQVIRRIIASDTRPLPFLMGKVISAFCIVWLQFTFILTVSNLLLGLFTGRSMQFWMGLLGMVTVYALTVAGLTAIFTTLTLRFKNIASANGVLLLITMALGLLGGNFVPMMLFPEWMQRIGEWTPNGVAMAAATEWVQFEQLAVIWTPMAGLLLFGAGCLLAGMAFFPKRGEA